MSKYLLNERECREFLKKYPIMTELLIRKIRDYINYVDEILQHFYQDRETISKEFHIEQNTMEITKISFNQDDGKRELYFRYFVLLMINLIKRWIMKTWKVEAAKRS